MKPLYVVSVVLAFFLFFTTNSISQDLRMQPAERVHNPTPGITVTREPAIKTIPSPRENKRIPILSDLFITKLTVSPRKVHSGDDVTLKAEVKNSGGSKITNVTVRFMHGRMKLGEKTIPSIRPQSSAAAEIIATISGKNSITVSALVDPDKQIPESNEGNNTKQLQFPVIQPLAQKTITKTVAEQSSPSAKRNGVSKSVRQPTLLKTKPDLLPITLKLDQDRVLVRESIVAQAVIRNIGNDLLDDVPVAFLIDNKRIGLKNITIPANRTSPVTFRFVPREAGKQTFSLIIDPENIISERNRYNNSIETDFEVIPRQSVMAKDNNSKITKIKNTTNTERGRFEKGPVSEEKFTTKPQNNLVQHPKNSVGLTKKVALEDPTTQKDKNKPYDLVCSVPAENGLHQGSPAGIVVRVENKGTFRSPSIIVGFGLKKELTKNDPATWLGSKRLSPGVLGGQWEYVIIPWQKQTLGDPELVALVDLLDEADETNEANNVSNTFHYSGVAVGQVMNKPADAFEAFSVSVGTASGTNKTFTSGSVLPISWSLITPKTPQDKVNLLRLGSKVRLLLYDISNKQVAHIVPDVPISHPGWGWTIPSTTKSGYYYVVVESQNQLGTGASTVFHISESHVVTLKDTDINTTGVDKQSTDPQKLVAINNAPRINYRYGPNEIFQRPPPQGPGWHVSNLYHLPLTIYWTDPNSDLENGGYRVQYKSPRSGDKDSGWKKLGADFRGSQGLSQIPITLVLDLPEKSWETVEYSLTLKDEKGYIGNTITGVVKVYAGLTPDMTKTVDTSSSINPLQANTNASAEKISLNIDTPSTWVPGLPVTIAWSVPATGGNPSEVTHDISLMNVSANGSCGPTTVEKIVSKLVIVGPVTPKYNHSWKVNQKLAPGTYCLKIDSNYYVQNRSFSGTKQINVNKYGLQLEPIQKTVYSGDNLLLKWKKNATLSAKGTLYWHSLVDGKDYTIALNVDLQGAQQTFLWQAGSCLTTKNGKIPFGAGRIFLQAGTMDAESNAFSVLEPDSGFQNLGIEIVEPTTKNKWQTGISNLVKWKYAATATNKDLDIFLINAQTEESVLGPYLARLHDNGLAITIPKTINSIPPGIPVRIKIKPRGRVSNDVDILSEPFEFK